jgi:hydrogenase-4 component B
LVYDELFVAAMLLPAVTGALIGIIPSAKWGRYVSTLLCGISCAVGILAYPLFKYYGEISYTFPIPSAWGDYSIVIGGLSSVMISLSSLVFLMVLIHLIRSASAPKYPKYYAMACLLYISCVFAMSADTVFLLLLSWESVTLVTFLMAYSGKGEGPRWKFFVTTHLGGLMIVSAFVIMAAFAGTYELSSWSQLNTSMGLGVSCVVIILLFIGFGTKLGLIPFHAWMPDMYSEAPTHTVTLLTTVSSNVAILILFKSVFGYVGITGEMYGIAVLLMALAAITAVWSALESLVQTDPKKILAYSSMENMALVLLCFSLGMIFADEGATGLVTMVLVAGLLHTMNHSVFKSLMMMSLGTVEDCTGETTMERMGGLAVALPAFSMVALAAVLSMAAVPPFNGFTSEWLMIQSMMGGEVIRTTQILLPLGVAVLGISGMMAAVSYARLYGFMFLGRPRSAAVAKPKKIGAASFAPLLVLALLCFIMGLFAVPLMDVLANGVNDITLFNPDDVYRNHLAGTLDLPMMGGILLVIVFAVYALNRLFRKHSKRTTTWDCGTDLEEDMQYSSIGFSQPLVKVFHPVYGDVVEIVDDGSGKDRKKFTMRFAEPFVERLYGPLGRGVERGSKNVGRIQNGNIQSYMGYILIVLVVLLVAVRFL